jgi:hypothetical protein
MTTLTVRNLDAVMSNHFHLVVSRLPAGANAWRAQQIAKR